MSFMSFHKFINMSLWIMSLLRENVVSNGKERLYKVDAEETNLTAITGHVIWSSDVLYTSD